MSAPKNDQVNTLRIPSTKEITKENTPDQRERSPTKRSMKKNSTIFAIIDEKKINYEPNFKMSPYRYVV